MKGKLIHIISKVANNSCQGSRSTLIGGPVLPPTFYASLIINVTITLQHDYYDEVKLCKLNSHVNIMQAFFIVNISDVNIFFCEIMGVIY